MFEDKVRAFLINYVNQVSGATISSMKTGITNTDVIGEYRILAGHMENGKWGNNEGEKVNKGDGVVYFQDLSCYAKDNTKPYIGNIEDFGNGEMGDENTIDAGSFQYSVQINPQPYANMELGDIVSATSSSKYGLSKKDKNGKLVKDSSGHKPTNQINRNSDEQISK